MPRFFDLSDDLALPGRWQLGNPLDREGVELDDPWQFTEGHSIATPGPLKIPVEEVGRPLDFTLAGLSIPLIHVRLAPLFMELAPRDVQLLPAEVEGHPDQYCLLVATRLVRCIDDVASEEVLHWTPEDGRPEKVGQYRDVAGMRIHPAQVGDAQVFRTWGWSIALIVSERIRLALEHAKATGLRFREV